MDLKHIQSDSCTYNRKLRQAFHSISVSNRKSHQYLKNHTLIKTGTIGLVSCIIFLTFAIIQYALIQSLKCSSDVNDYNFQPPAARQDVNSNCSCDNSAINPTSVQSKANISFLNEVDSIRARTASMIAKNSYSIKKQLEISESIWERSVAQRHAWILSVAKNNLSNVNPWDGNNYVFFWNYFSPSFNCPHSVQRVGFIGDGGKWLCGLELYEDETKLKRNNDQFEAKQANISTTTSKPPCIIYSFGVANESSFEAEMLNRTNCQVFAYDYSVKSIGAPVEQTNPRVTFKALGIGNKNLGKLRTLKYFMDQNGHDWIDILKMDIEGGEYAALDKVMQDFPEYPDHTDSSKSIAPQQQQKKHAPKPVPFGQLLLEVHVDAKIFPKFYEWWERLEARGLRAYSSEVNHVACALSLVKPNFVEYSFINIRGAHRLLQM